MAKRRRQYRTKPYPASLLKVFLGTDRGAIRCSLEDLSVGGMRLSLEETEDPRYALREIVPLHITSGHLPHPLILQSVVTYRAEAEGKTVYGFEFIDWLGLLSQLPPSLRSYFNQRHDQRVAPAPEHPVEVMVRAAEKDLEIQLEALDVSPMGLSFVVGFGAESLLHGLGVLDLRIRLPGVPEELRFKGKVLSRNLVAEGIRYGVYLPEEDVEGFERQQELLVSYVMARRREILGMQKSSEQPVVSKDPSRTV